jgi:hypothetical protein
MLVQHLKTGLSTVKSAIMAFAFGLAAASDALSQNAVGLSSISLPNISRDPSFGAGYASIYTLEEPLLGTIDFISMQFFFFPQIELIEPSHVLIENNRPELRKGNILEFASSHAHLFMISPRAYACYFSNTTCFGFSPLTLSTFANSSELRTDSAPMVSLQLQLPENRSWRLYSSIETNVLQNQTLWSVGTTF